AVPEAGDVAELVDGLGQQAVVEARVAGGLAVELGAEAGDADESAAAVNGGLAEHEVEARDEEVAIEHGERPDARRPVAVDEGIEDDVGAVLGAVVVVPVRVWLDGRRDAGTDIETAVELGRELLVQLRLDADRRS